MLYLCLNFKRNRAESYASKSVTCGLKFFIAYIESAIHCTLNFSPPISKHNLL